MLLMAEIVALKYYSVIRNGTRDAAIQRVCEQVLHDEKCHVRFHCEYLHRRITRMPAAVAVGLTAMFAGASAVVAWDHRDAHVALESSPEDFLADSWENFPTARQAIVTGEPFVWSRTLQRVESPTLPARQRAMPWLEAWSLGRAVALCGWRAVRFDKLSADDAAAGSICCQAQTDRRSSRTSSHWQYSFPALPSSVDGR